MFLFSKKPKLPYVSAVVAAAGTGSRMDGIDKQQTAIDHLPVVVRSMEALSQCALIREIVLVCPPERIPDYYALVREYRLDLVASVVGGGQTRQDSVFAGIDACHADAAFYAIHDGARPLVTPEVVERCVLAAVEHGAAAVGVTPKDTIKQMDEDGFIVSTPARSRLAAIQTPQIFEARLYQRAMELARREQATYTDDCQLVERLGHKIRVVPGSYENIKITTPEDFAIAGAVLQYREEGSGAWQTLE